jgi:hypothetical protein
MNDAERITPDVFSAELHFALLTEGVRGPMMRQLMRLARRDPELGHIFETKVAEYRRFLRADRKPSWRNLPARTWEKLFDNARFTPPKEVLMTLFYVGVVMAGIELFKRTLNKPTWPDDLVMSRAAAFELQTRIAPTTRTAQSSGQASRMDAWMIDELQRVSQSPAWREAFARQLAETIEHIDLEPALTKKMEAIIQSPAFSERVAKLLETPASSFRERGANAKPAVPNSNPADKTAAATAAPQSDKKPAAAAPRAEEKPKAQNAELAKASIAPGAVH